MADPRGFDTALRTAIAVLVVAILGLGAWFGYNVYTDRKLAEQSTPALRLLGSMKQQVSRNPNDAGLRVRLGEAYAAANQPQKAIEQFNAALKISPEHTGAMMDLGYIAASQNRPDEARTYYQKVIDLTAGAELADVSDRRERAFYQLGLLEFGAKNFDAAVGDFKSALRIRDDASDTYYYLAHALYKLDQNDEAMRNVQIALQFDPNFSQANYFLGQLYFEAGDLVNASYYAGKSAQLTPDAPEPEALLAKIGNPVELVEEAKAKAESDLDGAIESVTIASNLDPINLEAATLKAELLLKAGDKAAALKAYQAASELDPGNTAIADAIKKLKSKQK
ncbi:MAG: tetratricopeptide repeat protein [Coriobacteriia bacterium]|nr:tetratricopeptide repeat protein [Coriobacteriia bacterium]